MSSEQEIITKVVLRYAKAAGLILLVSFPAARVVELIGAAESASPSRARPGIERRLLLLPRQDCLSMDMPPVSKPTMEQIDKLWSAAHTRGKWRDEMNTLREEWTLAVTQGEWRKERDDSTWVSLERDWLEGTFWIQRHERQRDDQNRCAERHEQIESGKLPKLRVPNETIVFQDPIGFQKNVREFLKEHVGEEIARNAKFDSPVDLVVQGLQDAQLLELRLKLSETGYLAFAGPLPEQDDRYQLCLYPYKRCAPPFESCIADGRIQSQRAAVVQAYVFLGMLVVCALVSLHHSSPLSKS